MTSAAKQEFAELLRKYREQAGFESQRVFAHAADVNRSTVSRAENKDYEKFPQLDTFRKMIEQLRIGDARGRPCSEDEIRRLEEAWQPTHQENDNHEQVIIDPNLRDLADAIDAWPGTSTERIAIVEELNRVAVNWQIYHRAMTDLDQGGMYPIAQDELNFLRPRVDGQPRLKMRVLVGLAYTRRYMGETKAALDEELNEALKIAKLLDPLELEEQANLQISMGDFNRRLGNLDEALTCYQRSASVFKRIVEERFQRQGIATIERKLASVWLFRGEPLKAEKHCRTSIQLFRELNDRDGLRKAEQHLAWALALLGNYGQALEIHRSVLADIEAEPTKRTPLTDVAKAKRYNADVLRMSGQYNDALSAYLEALDDLREYRRYSESSSIEEETLVRGPILLGQGQTYVRMGKLQEASAALAESARANADDPFFLAQTQNALGKLAIETGNYEEAARRFDRAASLFEKPGNVYYQAALQVNRAELEYRLGKLAAVRRWAKEVVHRTADDNIKVHRIRAHVWLAIADTTEWTADDPTAEFFMALRMAVADLDNIYLCREILKQYQDQIAKLKSRLDSEKHRELSKHIDNGLDSIRTHNRSVQAMLDEWHKEVRGLCGDGT